MRPVTPVLPVLSRHLARRCLASMGPTMRDACVVVDNTMANRGVAASWNAGMNAMRARGHDWLLLVSTSVEFGKARGDDLLEAIDAAPPNTMVSVIHAGWHLHAIPASMMQRVGEFDEGFLAYYEDNDWLHRMVLAGWNVWDGEGQQHVEVDCTVLADGESLRSGLVDSAVLGRSAAAYQHKWGGPPRRERWTRPFDREEADWRWLWRDERKVRWLDLG